MLDNFEEVLDQLDAIPLHPNLAAIPVQQQAQSPGACAAIAAQGQGQGQGQGARQAQFRTLRDCVPYDKYKPFVSQCRTSQEHLTRSTAQLVEIYDKLEEGAHIHCCSNKDFLEPKVRALMEREAAFRGEGNGEAKLMAWKRNGQWHTECMCARAAAGPMTPRMRTCAAHHDRRRQPRHDAQLAREPAAAVRSTQPRVGSAFAYFSWFGKATNSFISPVPQGPCPRAGHVSTLDKTAGL